MKSFCQARYNHMDLFPYQYLYIYTIILGAISLLLLLLYKLSPSGRHRPPPEASGAWPIIGHLHLLRQPHALAHHILGALADKYGPIFTLRFGFHKVLVVSGSEIAKQIITSHDTVSSSRPKFRAAEHLGYNYAMFGFSPYGPYWREIRKITSLELLSNRRHDLLKHHQLSETKTSITELFHLFKDNKAEPVLVDMKKWFNDLTYNVIVKMVVGKRYFGSHVGIADQKDARECQKVMRDFFRYLGLFLVSDFVPFLGWFDRGYEKLMKNTAIDLDGIFEKWLQEHKERRKNYNKKGNHEDEQDFMDVMMNVVDGSENLAAFDADTIVKSTCMAIITGGSDTTAVMLIWALSLLLNNGDALRKVQQELDFHIGNNTHVEETDIDKLVYLQAVVKETLRLYPAGPLGGRREFSEDCTIGGYHISKGTWMVTNMWKLQRDPVVWPDPSEFKPERFLTTHKDIDVKGQQYELIPFGSGRRICPGVSFGLEMMHLVLANLVHAFEISTENDVAVDMTESAGMTNMKATPLHVLLKPRRLSTSSFAFVYQQR